MLQHYLSQSLSPPNTLLDVTLPYPDLHHPRTYLGRYLILEGQLRGVRMHTNASALSGAVYANWPRYKAKKIKV